MGAQESNMSVTKKQHKNNVWVQDDQNQALTTARGINVIQFP